MAVSPHVTTNPTGAAAPPSAPAGSDARRRLLAGLPVEERRLDLAGIPTAVLEGGDGPPLVLLHGPGEFALVWLRVVPELVRTHRVVVPDLPGHGGSLTGDAPLDRGRVLAWLGELIERTCPSPPALVGHLLGGAVALRFAAAHPGQVGRLDLVDTFGLRRLRPRPAFALGLVRFLARPTERSRDRFFRQCFADMDGLRAQVGADWDPLMAYALERALSPEQRLALRSLMPAFGLPRIPDDELARIEVPASLIWGRYDRQTPLSAAERASARSGWPLHVIEGAADDPAFEQPEAFLDALGAAVDARSRT